ncbi:AAA family ATPase [Auraticoccus monumenti]|uniref:Pilus assembly protein CpaE n=1 Tax=Auraticoccus monumenti TaxID=675864 RepID=A0A1G6YCU7_9ACTN|nr:AAA family ATPase [Auraticoccus monumenti]SDD87557.1 pilus assembly protein CpaE [Auraticoccus monumenti]
MSRILLVSPSEELEQRVHQATGGAFLPLRAAEVPADAGQLFAQLGGAPAPDVVVLDLRPDPAQAVALAGRLAQQCPQISVVLVGDQGPETALAALRAGVRDLLPAEAGPAEIKLALELAARSAAARASVAAAGSASSHTAAGRVISVVSPKGGVGKTTVAANLAVGLAQRFPSTVVLVDLDIQFGDVSSALDLEPEYFLVDTVRGAASTDSMVLKTVLTRHSTGLYVICAPDSPADADTITEGDVARLLQMLAAEFRYVVVDTAPGLSEHTLAALDQTTDLLLLTSMDVPGVRGMRKELDTLRKLELLPSSHHVVLNFADPRSLLTIADVEFTIGTGVDVQLPRSKAVPDSVDQGVPLLQSGRRDPMTKQLSALVDRFVGADGAAVPPGPEATGSYPTKKPKVPPRRAASRWRRTRTAVA